MNLPHLHLLLNHFPVIGMMIAFGLFVAGLLWKSDDLKRASLVIFLGISLLSIATYVTGNAAGEAICDGVDHLDGQDAIAPDKPCRLPLGASRAIIQMHEDAAFTALGFMELCGVFAWLGLWQFRRTSRIPAATLAIICVLSVVTLALMSRAANMGGDIRHPEISDSAAPAQLASQQLAAAQGSTARKIGKLIAGGARWGWPACESIHFIGLCLLFGVATLVDLRMLGMMKAIPFSAVHRLLPWGVLGFGLNVVTGMLFFVASPWQYSYNVVFQWKVALMLLAGLNVLYFTIFEEAWTVKAGDDAPFTAKFAAASALVLVYGVIFCGRMLPFIGGAF